MPLYHLIQPSTRSPKAKLTKGLTMFETLGEWIVADGLTHMKIKLAGDDR